MGARFTLLCCLLLLLLCSMLPAEEGYGPLITNGLDEQLAIGADLFFSETFEGNGRTCATCHFAADNYTVPADLSGISDQDPLMVGDPDNPNHVPELELCDPGNGSENCQAIRQNGLILVNADENLPGIDGARSYSMRSIPHVLSLATTINTRAGVTRDAVGWSGDGAPDDGTLRDFATGAVRQHFTLDTDRDPEDFRDPDDAELDAMLAFQLALGRVEPIDRTTVDFFEANATAARDVFGGPNRRCSICHGSNGGLLPALINANLDTGIEQLRMSGCPDPDPGKCAQNSAQLVPGANFDGGFGLDDLSPADDRWGDGTFNVPPVIEAADTGPFFHDNRSATLEAAIGFYRSQAFLDSPACNAGGSLPCGLEGLGAGPPERQIGAMLRILNAGLNLSMAAQRLNWAIGLLSTEPGDDPSVIKTVVLAREEVADARGVIDNVRFGGVPVFQDTDSHLTDARHQLDQILVGLDGNIANGTSTLQLLSLLAGVITVADDHLSDDFYDESTAACGGGLSQGEYHDCRWLYDLGEANVLFDNAGVTPSVVNSETKLTWTGNMDGTATLTLKWRTAEWTNPLFDETVLTDLSPNPAFSPITFTGSATQLPDGQFERSYSYTVACVPNAKYRMDISARVGGVTEADFDTAKAPRYCISPPRTKLIPMQVP